MKKFITLLLFTAVNGFSQNYNIIVDYERNDPYDLLNENIQCTLIINDNKSNHINYKTMFDPSTVFLDEDDKPSGEKKKYEEYFFKNFADQYLLSYADVKGEYHSVLLDSMGVMQWQIGNNEKSILGYNCIEAKTTFRGRNYTAFFAIELPFSDGPWKFCGLPGLILEVKEETGRISYKAYNIQLNARSAQVIQKFDRVSAKSWEEIIKSAKIKYQVLKNEMEAKFNGRVNTNFSNNIEIYDLND